MQELYRIHKLISDMQLHNTSGNCLDIEETQGSYYVCRKNDDYVQNLSFDTPIQLSNYLRQLLGTDGSCEDLIKTIVVLAFKLRAENTVLKEEIKERIYNF